LYYYVVIAHHEAYILAANYDGVGYYIGIGPGQSNPVTVGDTSQETAINYADVINEFYSDFLSATVNDDVVIITNISGLSILFNYFNAPEFSDISSDGIFYEHTFPIPIAPITEKECELTEITFNSTITLTDNPSPGDTLVLKGGSGGDITFTFVDHYPNNQYEIQIGATASETAASIATAINNIAGAEFVATVIDNVITVIAYSPDFEMETDAEEITLGIVTNTIADINDEEISASDSFTAEEGGKSVQENASASDAVDGLIDGLSETVSATAVIDCLMDSMDENANASAASDNFDGLIDYMGDET
jgi:hypothetical protein